MTDTIICSMCGQKVKKICPDCGKAIDKENGLCGIIIPKNHCLNCKTIEVKKVNYKYGIWDKTYNNLVKDPNTNKPILFEYAEQGINYIKKIYNNSNNFTIFDISKIPTEVKK